MTKRAWWRVARLDLVAGADFGISFGSYFRGTFLWDATRKVVAVASGLSLFRGKIDLRLSS